MDADVDLREVEKEVGAILDLFDGADQSDDSPEREFEDVVRHEKRLTRAVIRNVFKEYMKDNPIRKIQTLGDIASADEVARLTRTETHGNSRITVNTNIRVLCLCAIKKVAIKKLLSVEDLLETGTRERIREEMAQAGVQTSEETWLSDPLGEELGWFPSRRQRKKPATQTLWDRLNNFFRKT